MGKKDVFGIVVNLNHTDTYNNGYYCVYKHQVSFVLETSIKSMQLSNGIHYHQWDSRNLWLRRAPWSLIIYTKEFQTNTHSTL